MSTSLSSYEGTHRRPPRQWQDERDGDGPNEQGWHPAADWVCVREVRHAK